MLRRSCSLLLLFPAALMLAAVPLVGCGDDADGETASQRVAVIPKGLTHEFWKSVHAGAVKAGRELDIEIIWQGPPREGDVQAQLTRLKQVVAAQQVDGVVIAPTDKAAISATITSIARSGKPVVVIDSAVEGTDAYASFVATNNYAGGQLAGQALRERMEARLAAGEGPIEVMMLRYAAGHESTAQREQGFLDAMADLPDGIVLVSTNQRGGATRETAKGKAEALLLQHPNVAGVFAANQSTSLGMLDALRNKADANIDFVAFDASPELNQAVEDGLVAALVAQDPFQMGYLGVKTVAAAMAGKAVEKTIAFAPVLVTADNMSEPDVQQVINPPLDEYLD